MVTFIKTDCLLHVFAATAAVAVQPQRFSVACASEAACFRYLKTQPTLLASWTTLQSGSSPSGAVTGDVRRLFAATRTTCLPLFLGEPLEVNRLSVQLVLKYSNTPGEPKSIDYEVFYYGETQGKLVPSISGSVELALSNQGYEVASATPTAVFTRVSAPPTAQTNALRDAAALCPEVFTPPPKVVLNGRSYPVLAAEYFGAHSPYRTVHLVVDAGTGLQSLNGHFSPDGRFVYLPLANTNHLFEIK